MVQSESRTMLFFTCKIYDKSNQKPQRLRKFRAQFPAFSSCIERPLVASFFQGVTLREDICWSESAFVDWSQERVLYGIYALFRAVIRGRNP